MYMNSKRWLWIYMGYTSLTLAAFSVHWMHNAETQNCWQQTALILSCNALPAEALWISMDTTATIRDGLWYNEVLYCCSCTLHLPVTSTDAEWNCFEAYWCFVFLSYQSRSSANKCVFELRYSFLTDENGNCLSWRNSMGNKADLPPQLTWKTDRFLSQSAF